MELGTGLKLVGRKRDLEGSKKSKTKRGKHVQCREMKQKKLSRLSKTSQRRRARARVARDSSSKRRSNCKGNVLTMEEITS